MARFDILLNEDGSPQIEDGDVVIGESDEQNIKFILGLSKGTVAAYPLFGVDSTKFINGVNKQTALKREMQIALEADGYYDIDIDFSEGLSNIKITDGT